MISRCCDGCTQIHLCQKRFQKVRVNEFIQCPDGTQLLVDSASLEA